MSGNSTSESFVPSGDPARKNWGFEYIYSSFLSRLDSWSQPERKRNFLLASVISVVLVALGSVIPFPSFFKALISFPAALLIFCILLSIAHLRQSPDKMPLRVRFSPAKRRRFGYIAAAVLVLGITILSSYVPYAVGGTIFLVGILALYNGVRRTPEEIVMFQTGMIDPRDLPVDDVDIEDIDDDESDSDETDIDVYYDKDDDPWKDELK